VSDPGDQAGLVANTRRLLGDAALRAQMGANGRAYAERAFDIDAIAERFEQLLTRAARPRQVETLSQAQVEPAS
jgi:glycosyltransferase involved in cell wall biosynthesis